MSRDELQLEKDCHCIPPKQDFGGNTVAILKNPSTFRVLVQYYIRNGEVLGLSRVLKWDFC